MIIEQLYTNCLAEAAYYIESEGEAAIIDPIRETGPYLQRLKGKDAKLRYVFETHFHADFVSGHIDLAEKTGAKIVFGPLAETTYNAYNAKDGEIFKVGKLQIKVLHTPGHTPESSCFLLIDASGKDHCVFTGDTLFVGDVGRPDLLDGMMSKEELAGMMYESLNNKLKKLGDDVIVYPAHGPGSSCGKNIGKETWSTIGQQKKTNYAMLEMNKEKFIQLVAGGLSAPPQYFFSDAAINKTGYNNIDKVLEQNTQAMTVDEFKEEIIKGALVLDTREAEEFEKGFIKGAINIGLNGQYAIWVGTLIDIKRPLVIIAVPGKEAESILRLARVGYENVKGYLNGGIVAWKTSGEKPETLSSVSPEAFAAVANSDKTTALDVRKPSEYESGYVAGAANIELAQLNSMLKVLNKDRSYHLYCAGGYRSMIAASIMKAAGFNNITNVSGGYGKIKGTGIKIEVVKTVV
ncbi:MAG: MBL fold metallo-hydrolase [Bacteroidetes bacterium]|nr:MBL fold metallo-hydrolase [Bacteroidota bacterium]